MRMVYGHESWIAVVVFGGVFVIRALSSQRRKGGGGQGRPASKRSFTSSDLRAPLSTGSSDPVESTYSGVRPGWFADPFGRHDHRYWSGTEWTEHIDDDGVPGTDPPNTPDRGHGPDPAQDG